MKREDAILIAECDDTLFALIEQNIRNSGFSNELRRFTDSRKIPDFFAENARHGKSYILLVDADGAAIDGAGLLKNLREKPDIRRIPVVILSCENDQAVIDNYYRLGAGAYVVKPDNEDRFAEIIRRLGQFFSYVELPRPAAACEGEC